MVLFNYKAFTQSFTAAWNLIKEQTDSGAPREIKWIINGHNTIRDPQKIATSFNDIELL